MVVDRHASFSPPARARLGGLAGGETTGNERLTSAAGHGRRLSAHHLHH